MAITDKEQGVWDVDQVYNKINQGGIWSYAGFDPHSLYAWGRGHFGGLANNLGGVAANRSSPVQIPGTSWKEISAACNRRVMAFRTDGTLWTW